MLRASTGLPADKASFDKLRMRLSVFNELSLMVSLSRFGGLTVRPWATALFDLS
jgi:hypothetical protein